MHPFFSKRTGRALAALFATALAATAFGQATLATNVRVKLDREKAEILYDLPFGKGGADQLYTVSLKTDNEMVEPKKVTDAGNGIRPGINRKITWYYTLDGFNREEVGSLKLFVIAVTGKGQKQSKQESAAPPPPVADRGPRKQFPVLGVGLCAAGAGMGVLGFLQNQKALDDYTIYKDPAGGHTEEQYKLANDRHLRAQYLMVGGGIVVATGVVAIFSTRKKNRARLAGGGFGLVPAASPSAFGMGLAYRF